MILNPNARNRGALDLQSPSLIGLVLLAGGLAAQAQPVLTQPPPIVTTPPALQEFRASETGEYQPETGWNILPSVSRLLQWGPVNVRPHLLYSLSYADGILASPGDPESTWINQLSPGILFVIGSHWTLDYTPSMQWYSNSKFVDDVAQNVALNGFTTYEDWTFGLSQTYRSFTQPVVQTGVQTEEKSFITALNASYQFNSKVSANFGLNQDFEQVQQFQSYRQWSTMDWLNYQFWPKFNAGLGLGGGYVNVDTGADMTFEQFQGRVSWNATSRSSLLLHGGLEYRQFLSGGATSLLNPVYGLAFQTLILTKTSLSVGVDQSVSASYFANQVSESTSVSADVAQSITPKLTLGVGGSYGNVSYTSSAVGVPAQGGYDYTSFRARLTYAVGQRGTVTLTYQFNDNRSSEPGLSFTSNQVGLQLGYSF